MAGAETIERLRQYLRALTPRAQSLLIREFERSLLRGDEVAGADLVLQELRALVREQREGGPRIDHSARLFFKPFDALIVDDQADHNHTGRIARPALEPLWQWIGRDLMPAESRAYAADVEQALREGDEARTEGIVRAFQDKVAAAIETATRSAGEDVKVRRRLFAQIGTPRAGEDAATLKSVLKGRDVLATLAAHLPVRIGNLAQDELDGCKSMIESTAARGRDLFLYSLLTVMSRLSAPWQLIRLGIKAAGSDTAARVAETPYGVSVTIVLAELERLVGELRKDLRSGQGVAVGALLKSIHDAARGLRTELDLPIDSTWGRSLAAQRARIAELLRSEIDSMPGRVRRLLRPRPATEIRPHMVLDPEEVAETEALVEFVGTCRFFAGELALNEMTQRAISELQHYLDSGTRTLLENLRQSSEAERGFRQSQIDAAVRLSAKVFGKDYAALLARAAEVAAASDRRARA